MLSVIEHLRLGETWHGMKQIGEDQGIAVRQAPPVVVLLRRAARSVIATPFPNSFPVPVEFANRLGHIKYGASGHKSCAACVNTRKRNKDMAAFATDQCWIENYAGKARVFPLMHDIPVKVDEVRDLVGSREEDIAVERFRWIIARYACWVDARLGCRVEGKDAQR